MTARSARTILKNNSLTEKAVLTGSGQEWEIECVNDRVRSKVQKLIPGLGGYKTGYGAWCISQGYKSKGDPGDPSSAWHY